MHARRFLPAWTPAAPAPPMRSANFIWCIAADSQTCFQLMQVPTLAADAPAGPIAYPSPHRFHTWHVSATAVMELCACMSLAAVYFLSCLGVSNPCNIPVWVSHFFAGSLAHCHVPCSLAVRCCHCPLDANTITPVMSLSSCTFSTPCQYYVTNSLWLTVFHAFTWVTSIARRM
jgi:hypothetical protein